MNAQIAALPWNTLLTLAAGYAGYYTANIGVRTHHKAVDVTFGSLVFGFLGIFAYELCRQQRVNILIASIVAFVVAVILGGLWSKWGRGAMLRCLRGTRVSHNDDVPSAWVSLFTQTNLSTLQLSVKLTNGNWLKCNDLSAFEHSPNGPCTFGEGGDILMYVTHFQPAGSDAFEPNHEVDDAGWGEEITYIPREQIALVDIRRRR